LLQKQLLQQLQDPQHFLLDKLLQTEHQSQHLLERLLQDGEQQQQESILLISTSDLHRTNFRSKATDINLAHY
jgi:hypothetical protein